MDLSLKRVSAALNLLNNPQDGYEVIHIAGTNGKGSICSLLESILNNSFLINNKKPEKISSNLNNRSRLKIGKFTSPHLLNIEDSLRINQENISSEKLSEIKSYIVKLSAENEIKLTNFELLTVSMYYWFNTNKVDIAIVEVGLGGKLDATNVLKKPLVCGFASISLDHEAILGSKVKEIALHKAGILKENCLAVIAQQKELEAYNAFEYACLLTNSTFVNSGLAEICEQSTGSMNGRIVKYVTKTLKTIYKVKLNLEGDFQLSNLACALDVIDLIKQNYSHMFDIPVESVEAGVEKTTWPGRLHWVHTSDFGSFLVDGAHNPAAALELQAYIANFLEKKAMKNLINIYWVYSSTQGKNHQEILQTLLQKRLKISQNNFQVKHLFYLVAFSQPDEMSWIKPTETETLYNSLNSFSDLEISIENSYNLQTAFNSIQKHQRLNHAEEHLIVITGSLYLVADFFRYLDISY